MLQIYSSPSILDIEVLLNSKKGGKDMDTTDVLYYGHDTIMKLLTENQQSKDTIYRHELAFKRLEKYFVEQNVFNYNPKVTEKFCDFANKEADAKRISLRGLRRLLRISKMLDDVYQENPVQQRYSYGNRYKYKLSDCNKKMLDEYISWLSVASNSLAGYKSIIRKFLHYCEVIKEYKLHEIDSLFITEYFVWVSVQHKGSMNNVQVAIHKFILFLKTKGINTKDFTFILACKSAPAQRKIFDLLCDEDLKKLLTAPDRKTLMGTRDYAILMLPTYTGVRAIDVANLKLNDIDWNKDEIHFIQHKTLQENILPLEPKVKVAIKAYLQVRPPSNNPYVFQTLTKPYRKLNDISSVRNVLVKYIKLADIDKYPWDGKGFHAFRRRIAVKLLDSNTSIEMISQVLGHSNTEMLKHYLPLSKESMRLCALELDLIPVESEVYI